MYFDEKMLRKQIVLDYVDEKEEIVRVVERDQSVAWYACEAALGRDSKMGVLAQKRPLLTIFQLHP